MMQFHFCVEKRQELLTASTNAGAVITWAGHVEGDPVDQPNAAAEAEVEIQLHLPRTASARGTLATQT